MIENGKINSFQLWLLVVNFAIGSALLLMPSVVVSYSKQDAWISMIIAILIGAFIQYIMITLATMYPNMTLVGILQTILGKKFGNVLSLLYAWFFLHLSALVIRNATDFINTIIMPRTPMIVFSIMGGLLIYITIMHGIEVISRSNELFTPYAIGGFWLTIFLLIPLVKLDNIKPIFSEGLQAAFLGSYPVLGFPYAELVVFLMIFPFVSGRKHIKKVFIGAGIIAGISLFVVVIGSILVLNVRPTEMSIYATFNMARLVNIGDFITRVEVIIALAYIIVIFTKIVVSFYGALLAISQVFGVKDYRSILVPLIVIVVSLSLFLNKSIVDVINFASYTWTPYSLTFGFLVPMVLLVTSLVMKKFKKKV